MRYSITLYNNINELEKLTAALDEITEKWDLNPKIASDVNLAIDELVINAINYGFKGSIEFQIDIDFELKDKNLTIKIIDNGSTFNPLQQKAPDLKSLYDGSKIGGLGIPIVKKMVDSITYYRENNKNIVILNKNI